MGPETLGAQRLPKKEIAELQRPDDIGSGWITPPPRPMAPASAVVSQLGEQTWIQSTPISAGEGCPGQFRCLSAAKRRTAVSFKLWLAV